MGEEEILALTMEEAKRRAVEVLQNDRRFTTIENPNPTAMSSVELLAPELLEFFSKYVSVRAVYGDLHLAHATIARSAIKAGFIRIGTDIEHTEVIVRPGEEPVYILDDVQPPQEGETYPSVYHYILVTDDILYGDGP